MGGNTKKHERLWSRISVLKKMAAFVHLITKTIGFTSTKTAVDKSRPAHFVRSERGGWATKGKGLNLLAVVGGEAVDDADAVHLVVEGPDTPEVAAGQRIH